MKKAKEEVNPHDRASLISRTFFWWLKDLFKKGFHRDLNEDDLYKTASSQESSALAEKLDKAWQEEQRKCSKMGKRPRLRNAIFRAFLGDILIAGVRNTIVEFACRALQPLALGGLIAYFSKANGDITEAYWYAGGVIGTAVLSFFVLQPMLVRLGLLGMRVRIACSALVYRKCLKLTHRAFKEASVGQIVNMLSNDVGKMDVGFFFIHYTWIAPLITVLLVYFMYTQIGLPAVFGALTLTFFIPLQSFLGRKNSEFRMETAIRTDERLRIMDEIISGIQVIKMYAWESAFGRKVASARQDEVGKIRKISYLRALHQSFIIFTIRLCIFVTVLIYVLYDTTNRITAEKVFVVTACFNVVKMNLVDFLPLCIMNMSEVLVSLRRLENFLLQEELPSGDEVVLDGRAHHAVEMRSMSAQWDADAKGCTLKDLTLDVPHGSTVGVIGPVGCGKSSFLKAVLKEIPVVEGSVQAFGKLSYASQEPWIFNGTIKQNILFCEPLDEKKYDRVVQVCSLQRDLSLLSHGDETVVGERGITLSGGQKARINLARAIYRDASIYLLDDPLSAVDTNVGKEIFRNCIEGYLGEKTCILVTHQLQYLKDVDQILLLNDGEVTGNGTYRDLKVTHPNLASLIGDKHEDAENEVTAAKETGPVVANGGAQVKTGKDTTLQEKSSTGSLSFSVYGEYFKYFGFFRVALLLFLFVLVQVLGSASDFYLSFWVNAEEGKDLSQNTRNIYLYVFSGIAGGLIAATLCRSLTYFAMCMTTSQRIHNQMYDSISRAAMTFFNLNPPGRILNRFSKDIGIIDDSVPATLHDTVQAAFTVSGAVVLVVIVNPYLLIPLGIVAILCGFMRETYIRTSRSIKRIEGTTRSPIYSHISSTLQGLSTIRALDAQSTVEDYFDSYMNTNSSAAHLYICSSRALGFWLDLLCVIFMSLVTLSFILLNKDEQGGNVGLAITQCITMLGLFQWGIRQSTELSNNMTAVERVSEYTQLEQEPKTGSYKPAEAWPEKGEIRFSNVSLTYSTTQTTVLKGVDFSVRPGEKIGIVGRTGAGKTSLTSILFRLYDFEGSVLIDGVDTKGLDLHLLRSSISIIPQEPVLFSGPLRKNLDPFDDHSDDTLWRALDDVELKEVVKDLPAGLSSKITDGGTNLSVGQRQLVCLARAIVRNNKIIVMDEATANVDPKTDQLIQKAMRRKFSHCTVLTIAHRLHTVMDSDKVLVMDAGRVAQFGHPHDLLQDEAGILYDMVQHTGAAMTRSLIEMAKSHHDEQGQTPWNEQ